MGYDGVAYALRARRGRAPLRHRHEARARLVDEMMLRRLRTAAVAAAILGCADAGPSPDLRREVEANRARWLSARPSAYMYDLLRSCFCPVEYRGPVTVSVAQGQAVGARYSDSGEPVVEDAIGLFPSVDGLFEILLEAFDLDADSIQVDWDEATGIPLEIFIDYLRSAADEEVGYTVVSLPDAGLP